MCRVWRSGWKGVEVAAEAGKAVVGRTRWSEEMLQVVGAESRDAGVWVQKRGLGPRVLGNSPSTAVEHRQNSSCLPLSRFLSCTSCHLPVRLSISVFLSLPCSLPQSTPLRASPPTPSTTLVQHRTFLCLLLASGTHDVAVKFQNPEKLA